MRQVVDTSKLDRMKRLRCLTLLSLVVLVAGLVLTACGSSTGSGSNTASAGEVELDAGEAGGGGDAKTPGKAESDKVVPLLKVGFPFQVSNLSMSLPTGSFANEITDLALESLLSIGENGKLEPWLAEEWHQSSPTVYEYKLRKGVKFTDGNELTAEDVAFSWNYYRRPQAASTAFYFSSTKSIVPKGRYTVVVTLKEPNAAWQYTPGLELSGVFEKKFFQESDGKFGQPGTMVMGTGPWKFDSFDPPNGAELSANPDYWGGPVPIKRISAKFFSNENSMALAMRAGEIELVPNLANGQTFEATSGGAELTSGPSCETDFLSMPTKTAPWNDVHVRRAVAHIVNRPDLVSASGFSAVPSETLIPKGQLLTLGNEAEVDAALKSLPSYKLSLAEAKEEMAKSKYPEGFKAQLVTFDYGSFLAVDQVVAEQLKQIGIDVEIKNVGQNAWFAQVEGPPAKRPFTYTTSGICTPDPSTYDEYIGTATLAEGSFNVANYAPPKVDELITAGLASSDPHKRLGIYTELLHQLAVDVPYVPFYVQGVTFASNGFEWPGYNGFWHAHPWALELVPTS